MTRRVIYTVVASAVGFEPTTLFRIKELRMIGHTGTHELWNELNEVAKKWPKLPKKSQRHIGYCEVGPSNHNPQTRDHGLGVVGQGLSIELKLGKRSNMP